MNAAEHPRLFLFSEGADVRQYLDTYALHLDLLIKGMLPADDVYLISFNVLIPCFEAIFVVVAKLYA